MVTDVRTKSLWNCDLTTLPGTSLKVLFSFLAPLNTLNGKLNRASMERVEAFSPFPIYLTRKPKVCNENLKSSNATYNQILSWSSRILEHRSAKCLIPFRIKIVNLVLTEGLAVHNRIFQCVLNRVNYSIFL